MKIGFDAKRAFFNQRGLGTYSRNLISGLLTYYPEHFYYLYSPKGKIEYYNWPATRGPYQIRNPESPLEKMFPGLWRSWLMSGKFQEDEIELFHGLSQEIPIGIDRAKTKTLVTIHDMLAFRHPEFYSHIDRYVYQSKIRFACNQSDYILAICEETKLDLIKYLRISEPKIKVHYQSVHPKFYERWAEAALNSVRSKYRLPSKYLLYVGALEKNKNILNLLSAFAQIEKKVEHQLVIVGRGNREYEALVNAQIDRLNIKSRVRLLGAICFEDLPAVYQMADLFVLPSFLEGFGLPMAEALFSGVPVVASRGRPFNETCGPGALYIDPNSSENIAEAMLQLIDNRSLHDKMLKDGRAFVEKFTQKNSIMNLMKKYQEVF